MSFLTLQGKPNTHAWGAKSPTQHFPFLFISRDRPTALDYKYDDSAPADGGVVCPTPRSNQVICLPITIFSACGYYVQMLNKATTHCDLIHFSRYDGVP